MARIKYQSLNLGKATLAVIEQVNSIAAEYRAQGYDLTLRQLYYQFVSRDLIPNRMNEYKRLGDIVNNGRLAGLIDWDYITDRTRNLASVGHWDDPADMVAAAAQSHRLDKWDNQPRRVEVWVEKEALAGVVARAARAEDVAYFSCRGYTSQSEMWAAGRRLRSYRRNGQIPCIVHLGDHDPSGIDMTRDIEDRLAMFAEGYIEVKRIALNMDQIERYNPPPNPAKSSDSRFEGYVAMYGDESWELDALEPSMLDNLIRRTVRGLRDDGLWRDRLAQEAQERAYLQMVSDNWEDIRDNYITPTYGEPEVETSEDELDDEEADDDQ